MIDAFKVSAFYTRLIHFAHHRVCSYVLCSFRGEEELEEDVPDGDEPFYYLVDYEEIDRRVFDEESLAIFNEIDL